MPERRLNSTVWGDSVCSIVNTLYTVIIMVSDDGNREDAGLAEFEHSKDLGTRLISEYIEYAGPPGGLKNIEQKFHGTCSTLRSLMRTVEMAVDEAGR